MFETNDPHPLRRFFGFEFDFCPRTFDERDEIAEECDPGADEHQRHAEEPEPMVDREQTPSGRNHDPNQTEKCAD